MDINSLKRYLSQFDKDSINKRHVAELKATLATAVFDVPKETAKAKEVLERILYITIATSNK